MGGHAGLKTDFENAIVTRAELSIKIRGKRKDNVEKRISSDYPMEKRRVSRREVGAA